MGKVVKKKPQKNYMWVQYLSINMYTVGEFGIVYKGYIVKEQGSIVTDTVAVKTLKGIYLLILLKAIIIVQYRQDNWAVIFFCY